MYIPAHFEVEDRGELIAFMRAYNFACIVTARDGHAVGTHAPLVVRDDNGALSLIGHFAKANNQWKDLAEGIEALVIFSGPHAYVSPSLYESKLSVPTWNYTAVHAYGRAAILDPERAVLELVNATEPDYRKQWDELPREFQQKMLGGVAAFEIRVTRLEGKYKLSQNRPVQDQLRVADFFAGTPLGDLMKQRQR